ncbi:MAG: M50 family metallopeptidase [Bacteroidales bacterium]|nr:M50 family metallopeptidase [Bacteroidales bacterium]
MGIERYIIPFVVVILLRIKPIGTWLATINTFFHEDFHALTALLLGNKVKEIEFDQKLGGSCSSLSTGKFKTFLTALSGYTGCNLMSLILIYAINHSRIEITFLLLAIFSLLIIVLYMRKPYALVWTLAFATANLICYMIPFSFENQSRHIVHIHHCNISRKHCCMFRNPQVEFYKLQTKRRLLRSTQSKSYSAISLGDNFQRNQRSDYLQNSFDDIIIKKH